MQYWTYFLSLEKDFIRTLDFVELSQANAATYGDNYAKLILALGSEIDVLAKEICRAESPASPCRNILEYQSILTSAFPGMEDAYIEIPRTGSSIKPWEAWKTANTSPDWWRAYNEVKHDRIQNFARANQDNALMALAGLLVLNTFHYRSANPPYPFPILLDAGNPSYIVTEPTRKLSGL